MKYEDSAGGVVVNGGEVAVVFQEKTETWALPKGHIEGGESEEESARREIEEETGITDLKFVKKLGSYTRGTRKDSGVKKNITFLHFTTEQKKLEPQDPENPVAKWVDIDEVADVLSYKEDRRFFLSVKDSL